MKKTSRIFSLLAAAAMALSALSALPCAGVNVSAEEGVLPSGIAYEDIEKEIKELANGKTYASVRTAIFCGDEIIYSGGLGYADRENGAQADENTVYEWGSVSKTFVWVSVMQLYEQGKLDLDADVREYLPEGFFKRLRFDDKITMNLIMNHQAGWQESSYIISAKDESRIMALEDALRYSEPEQVFRPGETTAYSNWGTALAGYIVERISGEKFSDYVNNHIFAPLGMEHSSYAPDHRDNPWVREQWEKTSAYNIVESDNGATVLPVRHGEMFFSIYPAGAAAGTADDLAKFGQALVSDNCPLFEKQEIADMLFSPTSFFGDSGVPKCCHGFWCTYYAADTVGHGGNTDGFSANLVFDRKSKTGCAVLTNQYAESMFTSGIPEIIFGNILDNPMLEGEEFTRRDDLTGSYLMSREHHKGSLRMMSLTRMADINKDSDGGYKFGDAINVTQSGSGLILFENDGNYTLAGLSKNAEGMNVIEIMSMDYFADKNAKAQSRMITAYIAIAAISYILLMAMWIRKIAARKDSFKDSPFIHVALTATVVSCLCSKTILLIFAANNGITHGQSVVCGLIQIICTALFAVSAALSAKKLTAKISGGAKAVYAVNILLNIAAITMVVVLQLYRF